MSKKDKAKKEKPPAIGGPGDVGMGDRARDKASGFTGVVVGVTLWLNGCERLILQAEVGAENGKIPEVYSIDRAQLELIERGVVAVPSTEQRAKSPGGPFPTPAAQPQVTR